MRMLMRTLSSAFLGIFTGWWITSTLVMPTLPQRPVVIDSQPAKRVPHLLQHPPESAPPPAPAPSIALRRIGDQRKIGETRRLPSPEPAQNGIKNEASNAVVIASAAMKPSSLIFTSSLGIAPSSLPLGENLPDRDAFPPCLWAKLDQLCRARFHIKADVETHAKWSQGALLCMVQGVQRGRFKRSNVELEVTLMRGCIPDVLVEPPPPIGTSSLPIEALERSLGTRQSPERCLASRNTIDECHATTVPASADLLRLRKQLHRQSGNASISILALGASVTFMFADMCTEHDSYMCSTGPHETMQTFEMRLQRLRKQRGKLKFAEEADWLVQLLRTLKHGMPTARLSARSVAYGGMNPKAVAACVADFVAAPPADQQARAGSAANLVLLDFAIFGGVHPHSEDWHAIESLVRALYTMNVAVIMINMPTWCLGRTGRREGYVHGHSRCQRMIFNRTQSRANVGSAIIPDRYDDQLTRVAIHYGQTAISVFNALQPEIASGSVDLLDFTHDGKHPIMFPRGTRRGCILSRYMADLLAHAIDPSLLRQRLLRGRPSIWRGGEQEAQNVSSTWTHVTVLSQTMREVSAIQTTAGRASDKSSLHWRVLPFATPVSRNPSQLPPPALAPGLTSATRGVRCYGWGARATRGSWKSIMSQEKGWKLTRDELGYDDSARAWKPLAIKRAKPGLTSISQGDVMHLHIDTSLNQGETMAAAGMHANEQAMVQLTYLQSYEQVGVLKIECVDHCNCTTQHLQTLNPGRLATLNTSLWPISQSSHCTLRFTNVSPRDCGAVRGPCTKIKLVALAVAAAPESFDSKAATAAATAHVQSTVDLGFL